MAESWINQDAMLRSLMANLNAEMQKAAEPVLRKAVEEAEREMRKRLGALVVGLLEHEFSVERFGHELRITVMLGHGERTNAK
jgi:formate dehydrogenase maturation protein FdhE